MIASVLEEQSSPLFNHKGDHCTVVFNSMHDGSWSSEQREKSFPFKEGEEFKVRPCMLCVTKVHSPMFQVFAVACFQKNKEHSKMFCHSCRGAEGSIFFSVIIIVHFYPFFFQVSISFDNSTFQIKMPGNTVSFPNRFGANKFMFIQVQGDVRIKGFKIS
nr:16 kDa beta-galactoside-binding lectin-like [Paramormyrops kingsleyae]